MIAFLINYFFIILQAKLIWSTLYMKRRDFIVFGHPLNSASGCVENDPIFRDEFPYSLNKGGKICVNLEEWFELCRNFVTHNMLEPRAEYLTEWKLFPPFYMEFTSSTTKTLALAFPEMSLIYIRFYWIDNK